MGGIKLNTPLSVDEIDFRIQSISAKGYATILVYKDARVDMKRLDDVYGVEYWQKRYSVVNNNLFCSVGIYNLELKEWIWKEDVGTESMTEKEKGQASDAFKRACFNLGIGRELYDYPRIFLQLKPEEFKTKQSGNKTIGVATYDLKLNSWKWDVTFSEDKVKRVVAKDQNGDVRFDSNKDFNSAPKSGNKPEPEKKPANPQPDKKTELTKEQKIAKTVKAIEKVATLDALKTTWEKIPTDFKKEAVILKAKEDQKVKLTPKKAS